MILRKTTVFYHKFLDVEIRHAYLPLTKQTLFQLALRTKDTKAQAYSCAFARDNEPLIQLLSVIYMSLKTCQDS